MYTLRIPKILALALPPGLRIPNHHQHNRIVLQGHQRLPPGANQKVPKGQKEPLNQR